MKRRAEQAKADVAAGGATPVRQAPFDIPKQSAPASIDHGDYARRAVAGRNPRVRRAFERWVKEAERGPNHEMALREYRRDLIEWIMAGEPDPPPAEPLME